MMLRKPIVAAAVLLTLAACQQETAQPRSQGETEKVTEAAPPPKAAPQKPTSPERISEIEASGQVGLWATTPEVCASQARSGLRTTLVWNVKDRGAERVVVYVVGSNNTEQHFGQGGPVGEKETGPWLRPGIQFKIRDFNSREELASVTIAGKDC